MTFPVRLVVPAPEVARAAVVAAPAGALRRLLAQPAARGALAVLLALALALLLVPLAWPHAPYEQGDLATMALRPPSLAHPLGTDAVARDVLARVLAGGRLSLAIGLASVLLSTLIGTAWGMAAGLGGPRTDAVLMRVVDAGLAVPRVLVLLVVLAAREAPSVPLLVAAIAATGWFAHARLVRGEVRRLRRADWVLAARALGATPAAIARRHLLPHVAGPAFVTAALGVGQVIVLEAGLSWLGVGVQPPGASWGNIIRDGTDVLQAAPWISLAPGACLVAVVLCCSLVADGLRDALAGRELPRP